VFGKNSKVNVHDLIASSLDIDDQVFLKGLANAARIDKLAAFNGTPQGNITIEAGAIIETLEGGRVLVVAPEVINQGEIRTPGGQTILAGSYDRVYVAVSGNDNGTNDNLRGWFVEVETGGKVENLGRIIAERGNVSLVGLAVNQKGRISATTSVDFNGSIRLVARDGAKANSFNFSGDTVSVLKATLNSVPDASDPIQEFGVTLGSVSLTEVTPELTDTTTIDSRKQPASTIKIAGKIVNIESGAQVRATGGTVNISAIGQNDDAGQARVSLAPGSIIDVSGSKKTVLPMSRNQGEIELRGNVLADFPTLRDGVLRGKKITFDLRKRPKIGNLQSVYDAIGLDVGERTATGGAINITSDAVIDLQVGSQIDISGGLVTYQPGVLKTTMLVSQGRVFNFSDAPPELRYDAILTDGGPFGLGATILPGYVEGKDAGSLTLVAPDIALNGDINGHVTAGIFQRHSPAQLELQQDKLVHVLRQNQNRSFDQFPLAGKLVVGEFTRNSNNVSVTGPQSIHIVQGTDGVIQPGVLNIDQALFSRSGINRLKLNSQSELRIEEGVDLALGGGAEFEATALGDITVAGRIRAPDGHITLNTVAPFFKDRPSIRVASNGELSVKGKWVNDVFTRNHQAAFAPLVINGGQISLAAEGDLLLEQGSLLDVSGGAWQTIGGRIRPGTAGKIDLSALSAERNPGAQPSRLQLDGELRGFALEQGGSINLTATAFLISALGDQQAAVNTVQLPTAFFSDQGFSEFSLKAVSVNENLDDTFVKLITDTRLLVQAKNLEFLPGIQLQSGSTDINDVTRPTLLPVELRQLTKFSVDVEQKPLLGLETLPASIDIARGALIRTDPGGKIALNAQHRIRVSGTLEAPAGEITLNLKGIASATGFAAQGIWLDDSAALLAPGFARVVNDAQGRRTGNVLVGGQVVLQADGGYIVAAPGSRIGVDGTTAVLDIPFQDALGNLTFNRLEVPGAAGSISLTASEGILTYSDFSARGGAGNAADGALSISLDNSNRIANSDGAGNSIASPFIEDRRVVALGKEIVFDPAWMVFGSQGFDAAFLNSAFDAQGVINTSAGLNGLAIIDPERVVAGGFDALALSARQSDKFQAKGLVGNGLRFSRLEAEVRLLDNVQLALDGQIRIDAPILSSNGGAATLQAPYISIGSTNESFRVSGNEQLNFFDPTPGIGSLTLQAGLLDIIGFSSLQGFGPNPATTNTQAPVHLVAATDIRLRGVNLPAVGRNVSSVKNRLFSDYAGLLATATDTVLEAGLVYPTTLSDFMLYVKNQTGNEALRILGKPGRVVPPLSAGGKVTLSAPNIEQAGSLLAPLGEIAFGELQFDARGNLLRDPVTNRLSLANVDNLILADGSLTSVSGNGQLVPFGNLLFEDNWIFEINGVKRGLDEPRLLFGLATGDPTVADTPVLDEAAKSLDRPWIKRIDLAGNNISFQPGAAIDLSAGGDLVATEFRPGPQGSRDILASGKELSFAVMPTLGSAFSPVDPLLGFDEFLASDLSEGLPDQALSDTPLFINLATGSGLSAGAYAVLPRGYAVLPGAYLVTPVAGNPDIAPGSFVTRTDGTTEVAARFGIPGTAVLTDRWQAVVVESHDQVFNRAEYLMATGNNFFAQRAQENGVLAPQLPRDGGSLVLAASQTLSLGGSLLSRVPNGRSSTVDIVASDLAIVQQRDINATRVEIQADELSGLSSGSLLLGGRRDFRDKGTFIDILASQVTIDPGIDLTLPEVILVAKDRVTVSSGASLRGDGEVSGNDSLAFTTDSSGNPRALAFLRVSGGEQVRLDSDIVAASTGTLDIQFGAVLVATGSMTLAASDQSVLDGDLQVADASLSLNAERISIGNAPADASGIVLSDLSQVQAGELVLSSRSSIDFYGTVNELLNSLVLDSAGLRGVADSAGVPATVTLTAENTLRLLNTSQASLLPVPVSNSTLTLQADGLVLGEGGYGLSGFSTTLFSANTVQVAGNADLAVEGDLTVRTDLLSPLRGADLALNVTGSVDLQSITARSSRYQMSDNTVIKQPVIDAGLGGQFLISANTIRYATTLVAPSGVVELNALNGGNVIIDEAAEIDVAGRIEQFGDLALGTPGGRITLVSEGGAVQIADTAQLDIAGAVAFAADGRLLGDEAGTLEIIQSSQDFTPPDGAAYKAGVWTTGDNGNQLLLNPTQIDLADAASRAALSAELQALGADLGATQLAAFSQAYDGGSFVLDAAGLTSAYRTLAQSMNSAGFGRMQNLRLRTGDIDLASLTRAADFTLTADRGQILVSGRIDASGAQAGRVELNAGRNLQLVSGALIDASALAVQEDGGEVILRSRNGFVTAGQSTDVVESVIDVSGGQQGDKGIVRLEASRTADNLSLQVNPIFARVKGAARIEVAGNKRYSDIDTITNAFLGADGDAPGTSVRGDIAQFMTQAPVLNAAIDARQTGLVHVIPGVEIRSKSDGDLTVAEAVDLSAWRDGGEPGILRLVAGKDLIVANDLSDGAAKRLSGRFLDNTPSNNDFVLGLMQGPSWSYQLVSGADNRSRTDNAALADVASANPLAVVRSKVGSVKLNDGVRVRTGTGDIQIVASGNLEYGGKAAVIATLGEDAGFGNIQLDDPFDLVQDGRVSDAFYADFLLGSAGFGKNGGDIRVKVGGDINGPGSDQLITDWLVSLGGNPDASLSPPTAWAVKFEEFRQNLGALGGGDIKLSVVGDINDLSVVLPTTGQPIGPGFVFDAGLIKFTASGLNGVKVQGGGDLTIEDRGDIHGGSYLLAKGKGQIYTEGSFTTDTRQQLNPVLSLGEAQFDITARKAAAIETIFNFSVLERPKLIDAFGSTVPNSQSVYFTYGQGSRVSVNALSGDILLDNSFEDGAPLLKKIQQTLNTTSISEGERRLLTTYPGTFSARAYSGDILIQNDFQLYSDPQGSLELLADGNIADLGLKNKSAALGSTNIVTIRQLDIDPVLDLPTVQRPVPASSLDVVLKVDKEAPSSLEQQKWHALIPVHSGDTRPSRLVARNGGIGKVLDGSIGFALLTAEQTLISAGGDINNLNVEIQQISPQDSSIIQAGGSIIFDASRDPSGNFKQVGNQSFSVSGPGRAAFIAGKNIDLGTSDGIVSIGN